MIAANSVVTKDIPPFSIAAGAPAKVLKRSTTATSASTLARCRIPTLDRYSSSSSRAASSGAIV